MQIINFDDFEKPLVGKFFFTERQVWQFEENRIYLLPNVDEPTANKADEVAEMLLETLARGKYINEYAYSRLEELPSLLNFAELDMALKSGEYHFLLPLSTAVNNVYLLASSQPEGMITTFSLMVKTAENMSRRLLKDKIVENPVLLTDNDQIPFIPSAFSFLRHHGLPSFYGNSKPQQLLNMFDLKGDESEFVKNQKLIERLGLLAEKARKDKAADYELTHLCKNLPSEYIANLFKCMSPAQISKYAKEVNPEYIAEKSPMRIEVCTYESKAYYFKDRARRKNDGEYVIFFTKGAREEHICFENKYCFIVYLIFLLDRYKKGENIDAIDIYDKEKEYKELYHLVYPHDTNCEASFRTLTDKYREINDDEKESNAVGTQKKYVTRKCKYSDCLSKIRIAVSDACDKLDEFPTIHFIPSPNQHIYTKSNRLIIPYELIKI